MFVLFYLYCPAFVWLFYNHLCNVKKLQCFYAVLHCQIDMLITEDCAFLCLFFCFINIELIGILISCSGILIRTLADASKEKHFLSAPQIIFNVLGFCGSVAATIFFTMYAKRQLKVLQKEEELLVQ